MNYYKYDFKIGKKQKENTFFKNFVEIFIIFFLSLLPIIFHTLIPIFKPTGEKNDNLLVAQSLGYFQPIAFFTINITVLAVISIINRLKWSLNKTNRKNQPKSIIDNGLLFVIAFSIFLAVLFFVVMYTYTQINIKHSKIYNETQRMFILNNCEPYIISMFFYLIIVPIVSYYYFLLYECGITLYKLITITIFFSIIEITLCFCITFYTNLNTAFAIVLGCLIAKIIQCIVYIIVFQIKIASWRVHEIKFNFKIFKSFVKSIVFLGSFMFAYGLMMFVQMIFMTYLSSISDFRYLVTSGGLYTIIISRIIIYNIFNVLMCIPKSASRSILFSHRLSKNVENNLRTEEMLKKYCFYSILVTLIIGIIIFFSLNSIVESLFHNSPIETENIYPNRLIYANEKTYLDLIKRFVYQGFGIGFIGQLLVNIGIIYRVITFFFYGRNPLNFFITVAAFLIILGLGNYFLAIYWQDVFNGLIGFMLSFLLYGLISLVLILICYTRSKNKTIKKFQKELKMKTLC